MESLSLLYNYELSSISQYRSGLRSVARKISGPCLFTLETFTKKTASASRSKLTTRFSVVCGARGQGMTIKCCCVLCNGRSTRDDTELVTRDKTTFHK